MSQKNRAEEALEPELSEKAMTGAGEGPGAREPPKWEEGRGREALGIAARGAGDCWPGPGRPHTFPRASR